MAKLWTKDGGNRGPDPKVEQYCFGKDVLLDASLVYYDILGSIAHAEMLKKIGILDEKEHADLTSALRRLYSGFLADEWKIDVQDEDVHSAVEGRLGPVGEKLHTARSRNDQVLLDMRLFMKDRLLSLGNLATDWAKALVEIAMKNEYIPMPGYTHLQRAMPMSFGMWAGAFAEALNDFVSTELSAALQICDRNPLGSGAGYGVSLPIDREETTRLLGFAKTQINSLYCQNSRGLFESSALSALASLSAICGRFSSDICLFCSEEFRFLKLPDAYFTGSSIMPQKKNPDVFELARAKTAVIISLESRVRSVTHAITSGYSKDLQEIKAPVMEAFETVEDTVGVLSVVTPGIEPNGERLNDAMSPSLFAADKAYEMVRQGVPFRQAYRRVKEELDHLSVPPLEENLRSNTALGSTGNLQLKALESSILHLKNDWKRDREKLQSIWNQLLER